MTTPMTRHNYCLFPAGCPGGRIDSWAQKPVTVLAEFPSQVLGNPDIEAYGYLSRHLHMAVCPFGVPREFLLCLRKEEFNAFMGNFLIVLYSLRWHVLI
jgi:hypothetical protein